VTLENKRKREERQKGEKKYWKVVKEIRKQGNIGGGVQGRKDRRIRIDAYVYPLFKRDEQEEKKMERK
jgi:hypothetical protein